VTGIVVRIGGLTGIYVLVLTSLAPGDILVGALLASVLVVGSGASRSSPASGWWDWAVHLVGTLASTGREIVVGSIRVARFCLGERASPGFVEIPRDDRSDSAVALWGLLTGEAPDEYPVTTDEEREVLLVHVLDARDPDGVRERHARTRARWQRRVVR
jgi:multisubunit Na+/H+ antiporter MnhE subunit